MPVVQEEVMGCGVASVANILGKSYSKIRETASSMGTYAPDKSLRSETKCVRKTLSASGFETSKDEIAFKSWQSLLDLALLSVKYYQENEKNFWHWEVFMRVGSYAVVLDSASYLESNVRTDFDGMQPKWFIEVKNA